MIRVLGWSCIILSIAILAAAIGYEVGRYHHGKFSSLIDAAGWRVVSYTGGDMDAVFK